MQQNNQQRKNYLQLNAVRSPCEECDHHKAGLSKDCDLCLKCKKRTDYSNFVDDIMSGAQSSMFEQAAPLIIDADKYKKKPIIEKPVIEKRLPKKKQTKKYIPIVHYLGGPIKFDWEDIRREYDKKITTGKMTLIAFAKIFGISIAHLRRKRTIEKWPKKIKTKCNGKRCSNMATIKGKCKRCYQRVYMRRQTALRNKKRGI